MSCDVLYIQALSKLRNDQQLPNPKFPGVSGPRKAAEILPCQEEQVEVQQLTVDALKKFDKLTTPCELRQFACGPCDHSWWKIVPNTKPVSRCKFSKYCKIRYDALPEDKIFGTGRYYCEECDNEFYLPRCTQNRKVLCHVCTTTLFPYIHPAFNRMLKRRRHSSNGAGNCPKPPTPQPAQPPPSTGPKPSTSQPAKHPTSTGPKPPTPQPAQPPPSTGPKPSTSQPAKHPTSTGPQPFNPQPVKPPLKTSTLPAMNPLSPSWPNVNPPSMLFVPIPPMVYSYQPSWLRPTSRKTRKKVINESTPHDSTGSTESTFLTQMSEMSQFEDSDFDDFNSEVGECKFECEECGSEFTDICRMSDTAECHVCDNKHVRPYDTSTGLGSSVSTFFSRMSDLDLDDDEPEVGACKFKCECGNRFTVICQMSDTAECYNCHVHVRPYAISPPRQIRTKTNKPHSCSKCNGAGNCPNLYRLRQY